MAIQGVHLGKTCKDPLREAALPSDHMTRYRAVPNTVMLNPWRDDLRWVTIDATYPVQIDRRYELLLTRYHMVLDRLPDETVQAAEKELRDTVIHYVLHTYPEYFKRDGSFILSPLTGLGIDLRDDGADPLVVIALLASEDMLLLMPEKQVAGENLVFKLKSGALLFPNDWSLRSHFNSVKPGTDEKTALTKWNAQKSRSLRAARLGKTPYEIHDGHVPHYTEQYASRVDRFFARMQPGMRVWRRNWSVKMCNELCLHPDACPDPLPDLAVENWMAHGYLRSEQQTFIKLPQTGAVVFGIKTYLWKLSELVQNTAALNALIIANDNLPLKMVEYRTKELQTFRQFLDRYRPCSTRS